MVGTGRQKKVKYGLCLQVTMAEVCKNGSRNLPAKVGTVTAEMGLSQGVEERERQSERGVGTGMSQT